jgi:hypothetical protein
MILEYFGINLRYNVLRGSPICKLKYESNFIDDISN